jgi:hypothetical protein
MLPRPSSLSQRAQHKKNHRRRGDEDPDIINTNPEKFARHYALSQSLMTCGRRCFVSSARYAEWGI